MEVTLPKNRGLEEYLKNVLMYQKLKEERTKIVYRGLFEFSASRQSLGLNAREFVVPLRGLKYVEQY